VAYLAGAVRRVAAVGAVACGTVEACQAALDAARPDPAAAPDAKLRKVARKLAAFDRKADAKITKAGGATDPKRTRLYAKARKLLEKLRAAAVTADGRGRLGVPLAALVAAVDALVALLPT
jgi:hypothetical protein